MPFRILSISIIFFLSLFFSLDTSAQTADSTSIDTIGRTLMPLMPDEDFLVGGVYTFEDIYSVCIGHRDEDIVKRFLFGYHEDFYLVQFDYFYVGEIIDKFFIGVGPSMGLAISGQSYNPYLLMNGYLNLRGFETTVGLGVIRSNGPEWFLNLSVGLVFYLSK